jgi:hypothetical protein
MDEPILSNNRSQTTMNTELLGAMPITWAMKAPRYAMAEPRLNLKKCPSRARVRNRFMSFSVGVKPFHGPAVNEEAEQEQDRAPGDLADQSREETFRGERDQGRGRPVCREGEGGGTELRP